MKSGSGSILSPPYDIANVSWDEDRSGGYVSLWRRVTSWGSHEGECGASN